MQRLRAVLKKLSGKGYKAYKQLQGEYDFSSFRLSIDHVQGDPFAQPSRISLLLSQSQHGIPSYFFQNATRRTAMEDFLGRQIHRAIRAHVKGRRGTGRSGEMEVAINGQQVIRRNAVLINSEDLEARLLFALPGSGRSILADEAAVMLFEELPTIVNQALIWVDTSLKEMQKHIDSVEDQSELRDQLQQRGAVAFIADGSILPRKSGIDDHPLTSAIPFSSPKSLQQTLKTTHQGAVSGMLIPQGVTLIVGGGFHGKSTLLQALERGVYNHIPGDGRELIVAESSAVKIRAEDHRSINQVDISPFINTLPGNCNTTSFSTANASGSTSQAANIIEAMECQCRCLLIDEDTSATNFMIRDEQMQQLVPDAQEPITPLLHRVRELYDQENVSSIIVTGGSGAYLAVADHVLMLHNYHLFDVTEQAREIAGQKDYSLSGKTPFRGGQPRRIPFSLKPNPRQREAKIQVREQRLLEFGQQRIDLSQVEQLLDAGQCEAIGRILAWCGQHDPDQKRGVIETLRQALDRGEQEGLDFLLPWKAGHLAMPRLYELVAAANRIRNKDIST
jgi:predicted ABC-class ATPase